jgi:hypothetical protein
MDCGSMDKSSGSKWQKRVQKKTVDEITAESQWTPGMRRALRGKHEDQFGTLKRQSTEQARWVVVSEEEAFSEKRVHQAKERANFAKK